MFENIRHLQRIALLVLALSPSMIYAETGKAPEPEQVVLGKHLYQQHCQLCHMENGVGETPDPWLTPPPEPRPAMPLNETSHAWHHSDEQLADTILNGLHHTKRMPAFKGALSQKEALNIVAYIKSLWSPRIIACQGPRHMSCMH